MQIYCVKTCVFGMHLVARQVLYSESMVKSMCFWYTFGGSPGDVQ